MSTHGTEHWAPKAFHAIAEELGLADDLLLDAEVLFVEEARADLARACSLISGSEQGDDGLADAEALIREWAWTIMTRVLCRLEARPSLQFSALALQA